MGVDHTAALKAALDAAGYDDVFAGDRWPDSPDASILIVPFSGGPPSRYLDGGSVERRQKGAQVIVRGKRTEYAATFARAEAIYDSLRFADLGSAYEEVVPQGSPGFIGRDGDRRPKFSMNLIVRTEE